MKKNKKKEIKSRNPMHAVKHESWSSNVYKSKKTYDRKRETNKIRKHEVDKW